ncbi:MAG TPA: PBP1A family penicillin-binding protein [Nitrospiraceae bacterium]|nr:PBP1A family penicillin-binding protein [Nitrospiraceae bacterium]
MKRSVGWVTYVSLVLGGIVAALGLVVAIYGAYLATFLELPKSDDHPPLRLYSGPFLLQPNLSLVQSRLLERLQRLGYRQVKVTQAPGDYQLTEEALTVYLHPQPEGYVGATMVRLPLDQGRVTDVLSPLEGTPLFSIFLEPELLSGVRGESRQVREWIPLAQIPPLIIETVLTIEDRRFYSHFGIDPIAVGRAIWTNFTRGGVVQGGSTITQQLAKNLFYSPQRTMGRKFKEALAALVLEVKYTKQNILESYLNEIYLGQAGFVSIYGMSEAAHRYFGKTLEQLTVDEVAMVAGLIKGPNSYAPTKHPELAKQRRDVVLRRLKEIGLLTEEAWNRAVKEPVRVTPPEDVLTDAPYFVDAVLREVEEAGVVPIPEGSRIDSTLDPMIQQAATEALEKGLAKLEKTYSHLSNSPEPMQGAVVVLDPKNGSVLALVGGRDYRRSQFNRAIQARRQPGSLFKPFVYLAALEAAREGQVGQLTAASLLADEPVTFESGTGPWSPQNYDKQFHGPITVRSALEQSLNVPAVQAAKTVGTKPIVQLLHRLGVTSAIGDDLSSVALGSSSVSLLEITAAYGAIANGGIAVKPTAVRSTRDRQGDMVWNTIPNREQATSPQGAYVLTSLLEGVIQRGTASKAKVLGLQGTVAGKTGTTDGYRDAWFVGYTSDVVIGVWVGFDDERSLRLTGSQAALPIWMDLARRVIPPNVPAFVMPSGVVTRDIDPKTGQLATFQCPERVSEVFIEGTEPSVYCEVHGGGIWERLRHTFGFS